MPTDPTAPVQITRDGAVVTLRINRPGRENRLNLAVLEQLTAGLAEADADDDVRVVVMTGTGETFCCGGDVAEFAIGDESSYREFAARFAGLHLSIARLSKPVVAAANGDVRAGGLSLLSICDLAVAKDRVRFAMPEIRAGLWPILAMVALNRALPRKVAFELYYFGESFDVHRARELGLVNWVVSEEQFTATLRERTRALAELPVAPVSIGRRTFAGIGERFLEDGYGYGAEELVTLLTRPEVARALIERREAP